MTATKSSGTAQTVSTEAKTPANIPPAKTFDAAGAPQQIVPDVDPDHPAVDNDPRAGTSVEQNRIDFNDPGKSGSDAVAENLGMKSAAEAAEEAAKADKK